ncbi:alpha/beta-hydrolase [Lophiostoma macrostomum CBS 122681]|uniref:Alpha/beta-hydrolase n=1 Tax=Lophiostoma macrostomum CBS 122681 TaxID=1314788 RepID=A0A6A6SW85_9PLEO|nr:alpha/beta-hydrolase [Lophiostoma macrostomum CBS 122681]
MKHAILVTLGLVSATSAHPHVVRAENTSMIYDFSLISPTIDPNWVPCFDNFTCTRLQVSLDYSNPSLGNLAIAYIKKSALTPSNDTEDVLVNPGGPGGSGVALVRGRGDRLQEIIGDQFNIIGFDPRGVNNSGPALDCFPDAPDVENIFRERYRLPADHTSPKALAAQFQTALAMGDRCTSVLNSTAANYINTPAVAGDMLNYVSKSYELRGKPGNDAKLFYYGFSYGTALGATFAGLYPSRIGRMVLDGVIDPHDYYSGTWAKALLQTDEAVESFATYCLNAGPELCVFRRDSESSEDILGRMRAVVDDVRANPVPVSDPAITSAPIIADYEGLVSLILGLMYKPLDGFPALAQILLDLENRNGSTLIQALAQSDEYSGVTYGALIACQDALGRLDLSDVEKYTEFVTRFNDMSAWAGDGFAGYPLTCARFGVLPPESQRVYQIPSANNTSAPILLVSPSIDPVTPIVGARAVSELFPGSVVLEQNSVGHTSFSVPSKCTVEYTKNYFAGGTLPPAGTTCQPDVLPFQPSN